MKKRINLGKKRIASSDVFVDVVAVVIIILLFSQLGEMELRVGSNIMIHFLYILLFLIWHMYLYNIHC